MNRSALAKVNGTLWDMHKPLEEESTIELLHFHADDPFHVNRVFWRSCSFMLGKISHKKSLITIFGHKHKIKIFNKNLIFFIKKFQQPSILVYIWNKIANFESKLH